MAEEVLLNGQGEISTDTGPQYGSGRQPLPSGKERIVIDLPNQRLLDPATGKPLPSTLISVHTHPVQDISIPMPSDDPERPGGQAGDMSTYAYNPEQDTVAIILTDHGKELAKDSPQANKPVRGIIVYRGPIATEMLPEARVSEMNTMREVGTVLQERLPGTDIRVYSATFRNGQLSRLRQVY